MSQMTKYILVFITLFLSIVVNLDKGLLSHYGIDANILMIALAAFIITGLIAQERLGLIVLVIALVIGINLPEEVIADWGVDRQYLLVTLIAVILLPLINRFL
jgi:hypothetical protein